MVSEPGDLAALIMSALPYILRTFRKLKKL